MSFARAASIPFLFLTAGLVAQRPEFAAPVQRLEGLAQRVADALNGSATEDVVAARRADFDAGVDELLAGDLLTRLDYSRAATVAMIVGCPEACQRIARFAIPKFEQPGNLREFLGIANSELMQRVDTDAEMRELAWEALEALDVWCNEKPGSMGPHYLILCYTTLGFFGNALLWDDALVKGRSRLACPPAFRAMLLLGAERWDEALELLRDEACAEAMSETERDVLIARAEALRGDHAAALAVARTAFARDADDQAVETLADVLAAAGEVDEALALLAKHPVREGSDDPRIAAALAKSRAALAYLIGLRGERPADLRQQLAERLEVRFVVLGLDDETLSSSPWALGYTSRKVPSGPAGWANDLLQAVCAQDIATYEPPATERQLLAPLIDDATRAALGGDTAVRTTARLARAGVIQWLSPGALAVRRLVEKP